MQLSGYLRDYLRDFQRDYDYRHQALVASFEVDDLALSVGSFYEKVRKVIDWKDENALKRGTIARAVNRHLISQVHYLDGQQVGQPLLDMAERMIFELMRSGYFDNQLINASKVEQLAQILQKYLLAFQYLNSSHDQLTRKDLKQRIKLQNWTIQIMACEIEELLAPAYKTWALVDLMLAVLHDRITIVPAHALDSSTQNKSLIIAVWRSLYQADDYFLSYELLQVYQPDFTDYSHPADLSCIQRMYQHKTAIDQDLVSLSSRQYLRIANKYDAAYRLLGAITDSLDMTSVEQGEQFFQDEDQVQKRYAQIYADKYNSLKRRLFKTAFWTTLSIIIANSASVILLEWPVARWIGLNFGAWAIAWDIFIPTIAMFILVMLIRPPKAQNEQAVWQEIVKLIDKQAKQDCYEIRQKKRGPNKAVQGFFYGSTLVTGALGLYGLYLLFSWAGLPWTSIYLNLVYITMVLFASLSIRQQAQELTVYEQSTVFDFLLDLFSLPLARIGQWFSKKWKEYNVFAIIFTLLIDAPLSSLIGFIEDWRNYLKENKSEIR